jgi:hypothetical protein
VVIFKYKYAYLVCIPKLELGNEGNYQVVTNPRDSHKNVGTRWAITIQPKTPNYQAVINPRDSYKNVGTRWEYHHQPSTKNLPTIP